jgi:hypothetical protein
LVIVVLLNFICKQVLGLFRFFFIMHLHFNLPSLWEFCNYCILYHENYLLNFYQRTWLILFKFLADWIICEISFKWSQAARKFSFSLISVNYHGYSSYNCMSSPFFLEKITKSMISSIFRKQGVFDHICKGIYRAFTPTSTARPWHMGSHELLSYNPSYTKCQPAYHNRRDKHPKLRPNQPSHQGMSYLPHLFVDFVFVTPHTFVFENMWKLW